MWLCSGLFDQLLAVDHTGWELARDPADVILLLLPRPDLLSYGAVVTALAFEIHSSLS